ncbi:MAG: aromatic amino acid lyase [Desulfomicrobium escambiense]|nr:aromatic amino acid lyase [Desulfomicrobium escambiense]
MNEPVVVTDAGADLEGVGRVAAGAPIELSPLAIRAMEHGRSAIEALLGSGRAIYGVNTGFGRLATTVVEGDALAGLQRNLLLSHSCGTGPLLSREQVRVMIFLRVASLAREEAVSGPALLRIWSGSPTGLFFQPFLPVAPWELRAISRPSPTCAFR